MKKRQITSTWLTAMLLIAALSAAYAQTYTVVKPHGKVALQSDGKPLNRGNKFNAGPLQFATAKDYLVVINEHEAAYLLYAADATLKNYRATPLPPIGTKPGYILSDLQLRIFLSKNDSLLLLDGQFSLVLGKEAFPLDTEHFFYMEYLWKGDTIRKKLGFTNDTLIISAQELYKVDEHPIALAEVSENYYLYYYNTQTGESIAYPGKPTDYQKSKVDQPIYIIRPDDEAIKQEVKILLQVLKSKPFEEKTLAISDYLSRFYGIPGDWELEKLIKELTQ